MKKTSIMLIFLTIFSLIICQGQVYEESGIYERIEKNICNIEEVGVKLQYSTEMNMQDTMSKIGQTFNVNIRDINREYFSFEGNNKDNSLKVMITKENKNVNVEVEVISRLGIREIPEIKELLEQLVDNKTINHQYFTYVKGKIENENIITNVYDEFLDEVGKNKIKKNNSISIQGGTTGIVELKNNEQLNYSIIKYNNGTYLVVGTPIIFTTY